MDTKKNNIRAVVGTILFHALILVCFIFFGFTTPLPLPEEEGVEVNLGYSDDGTGDIEPVDPMSNFSSNIAPKNNNDYSTQNTEEAISLNKNNNKTDNTNKEEFTPDKNAMYNGNKNKNGGSQGITGKDGNQGDPNGNPNSNNYTGNSPSGNGLPSYKLSGRNSKSLPKPNYNQKDEGVVVVDIWVDKSGNVTKAIAGSRGSTTTNQSLWKLAVEAATRSKFDAKGNAPEEQKGTITYNFVNLN